MRIPAGPATNRDVAEQLLAMSRLLLIAGEDRHRSEAYSRAARQVDRFSSPVAGLEAEALALIPGIGTRIAGQIREIVETGSFRELDDLRAVVPASLVDMLGIRGIGPQTLHTLWKRLGILTVDDLERAVKGHRLRALRGFGPKKEEAIERGIEQFRRIPDRMTRARSDAMLVGVAALFSDGEYAVAGDYRRGASTVDGMDIVATGDRDLLMRRLSAVGRDIRKTAEGVSLFFDGERLNVFFSEPGRCGTALLSATGSAGFLDRLGEAALAQGYRFGPDGLWDCSDGRLRTFESEEEVFSFLGMETIPPELREDRGEIELALRHALPDLIDISDIRGDLHAHTTASDGRQSLEDVAAAGDARGYEYIAITDHSSRVRPEALARQKIDIERINRRHTCQLLAGSEVDIRSEGTLGYPDRVLADLDVVIASVHSGFDQNEDLLTRRILTAMENEHVDIIGHPTGRLLLRRPAYAIDLDRVMEHAAVTGTALEINASPHRLDLEDIYIRRAKKRGVRLAAGTDAHRAGEFSNMYYAVLLARRGWCAPDDVVNTLTLSELMGWSA